MCWVAAGWRLGMSLRRTRSVIGLGQCAARELSLSLAHAPRDAGRLTQNGGLQPVSRTAYAKKVNIDFRRSNLSVHAKHHQLRPILKLAFQAGRRRRSPGLRAHPDTCSLIAVASALGAFQCNLKGTSSWQLCEIITSSFCFCPNFSGFRIAYPKPIFQHYSRLAYTTRLSC